MFLDVWMATMRWFGAELWTRRVERAPVVFAEYRLRGGAAVTRDCDGEQARRTITRMTRQLTSVSSAGEWLIADLREKRTREAATCVQGACWPSQQRRLHR